MSIPVGDADSFVGWASSLSNPQIHPRPDGTGLTALMNQVNTMNKICYHLAVLLLIAGLSAPVNLAWGQNDDEKPPVKAPPMHALLSNTLNGWYFVPMEFKEQYDATVNRLEALQGNVDSGRLKAKEAQAELEELKGKLEDLRIAIEASKIHITGANIHEQTETMEFELGPEKRLAITANHVRVVGWDGPKVKVELKKRVLAPDEKPVVEHLQAMRVVHVHERARFAGKTQAEWDAEEREYLAGDGAKLTEEQRAGRRKLLAEIQQSYAIHRDLVGKAIDQLTVAGLDYQSNKSITLKVSSEGGSGQYGSVRQRYGELTVYVPRCHSVTVRGARRGLVVEGLAAEALIVTSEDSTDSDARGQFVIHGLEGDLISNSFPLQAVTNVTGHVTLTATQEFGVEGAGLTHSNNLRDLTPAKPLAVQVYNVSKGVDLRFGRVQLDLRDIQGQVNVSNDFGDTRLSSDRPFLTAAHRIVTQSGHIDVELSPEAWASVPILAVTNHGGIRTNVEREEFDDFHLEGADKHDGTRRSWPGFRTVVKDEDRFAVFNLLDRFQAIIENAERSAGLDLISRSGSIVIMRKSAN